MTIGGGGNECAELDVFGCSCKRGEGGETFEDGERTLRVIVGAVHAPGGDGAGSGLECGPAVQEFCGALEATNEGVGALVLQVVGVEECMQSDLFADTRDGEDGIKVVCVVARVGAEHMPKTNGVRREGRSLGIRWHQGAAPSACLRMEVAPGQKIRLGRRDRLHAASMLCGARAIFVCSQGWRQMRRSAAHSLSRSCPVLDRQGGSATNGHRRRRARPPCCLNHQCRSLHFRQGAARSHADNREMMTADRHRALRTRSGA